MTNCQVSENWKSGPLMPHTTTTPAANRKVEARPAASEVLFAKSPKNFEIGDGSCLMILGSTNDHNVVWAKSSALGTMVSGILCEMLFAGAPERTYYERSRSTSQAAPLWSRP